MKYSGWDYLDHMIQTCEELEVCLLGVESVDDFIPDVKTRRSVVMCLLDLGELLKSIDVNERDIFPNRSCKHLIGFRDRAAHGYHTMDYKIVYALAMDMAPLVFEVLRTKKLESTSPS